jgi:hypothetical protein
VREQNRGGGSGGRQRQREQSISTTAQHCRNSRGCRGSNRSRSRNRSRSIATASRSGARVECGQRRGSGRRSAPRASAHHSHALVWSGDSKQISTRIALARLTLTTRHCTRVTHCTHCTHRSRRQKFTVKRRGCTCIRLQRWGHGWCCGCTCRCRWLQLWLRLRLGLRLRRLRGRRRRRRRALAFGWACFDISTAILEALSQRTGTHWRQ